MRRSKIYILEPYIQVDEKNYNVWSNELKHKFHEHKNRISIYDVGINKILKSNKVSVRKKSFKYFIGYKDGEKVRSLCIMLPKISAYRRDFDETKYMS